MDWNRFCNAMQSMATHILPFVCKMHLYSVYLWNIFARSLVAVAIVEWLSMVCAETGYKYSNATSQPNRKCDIEASKWKKSGIKPMDKKWRGINVAGIVSKVLNLHRHHKLSFWLKCICILKWHLYSRVISDSIQLPI